MYNKREYGQSCGKRELLLRDFKKKILKEMGVSDHLTASWEICMQVKKQQLELDMEQQTGSK